MTDHQRREHVIDNALLLCGYFALIVLATGIGACFWALARRLWKRNDGYISAGDTPNSSPVRKA